MRLFSDNPAAYERRRIHLPMGRLATAREIANAALFLASSESSYVNGATFLVDGGLTAAYVTPEEATGGPEPATLSSRPSAHRRSASGRIVEEPRRVG